MGQKKGLIYNCFVILFLAAIWYITTNNAGYTAPKLPKIHKVNTPFDFTPYTFQIIITTESFQEIPTELKKNLKNVVNAFSQFWDVQVFFSQIISDNGKNLKTFQNSSKTLIFLYSSEIPDPALENTYKISDFSEILPIFVSILRNTLKFPTASKVQNGLTESEKNNGESFAKDWTLSSLYKEIELYNRLIEINTPRTTLETSEKIGKTIEKLSELEKYGLTELHDLLIEVKRLNSEIELGQEEYFKWDFKLGVYAPLFFPVLFPMSAAIYSRLFLRNKP